MVRHSSVLPTTCNYQVKRLKVKVTEALSYLETRHPAIFDGYMAIWTGLGGTGNPVWVSGITSRYKFHTSRQANFAIPILEPLYVASFARVLGRRGIYNISRELVKYGILHCPFIVIALDEQYGNYRKFVK